MGRRTVDSMPFGADAAAALIDLFKSDPMLRNEQITKIFKDNYKREGKITKEIFPTSSYPNKALMMMVMDSPVGMSSPYGGGHVQERRLTGGRLKQAYIGEWRDRFTFKEADLANAYNPEDPTKLLGASGLITMASENLDYMLEMRKEYLSTKVVQEGTVTVSGTGVEYTDTHALDATVRLDLNDIAASGYTDVRDLVYGSWEPSATWNNATTANPYEDIRKLMTYYKKVFGSKITKIYMPSEVWDYILFNDTMRQLLNSYYVSDTIRVAAQADPQQLTTILKIPEIEIYDDTFNEITTLAANITAGDGTIEVKDGSIFDYMEAGDPIRIFDRYTTTEETLGYSSVSGNTVTLSANAVNAFSAGSQIEIMPRFLNSKKIMFKTDKTNYQEGVSLPTFLNKNKSGKYLIQATSPVADEIWARITGGETWGIAVGKTGGFGCLKVLS